jgi:hypothetical protein
MVTGSRTLSLDTLVSSGLYFVGQWSPSLKRSQARDVFRLILNKLYGASQGSMFHARMRCSHAALAAKCDLSREWTCTLVGRLRQAGWIETEAPRLPGSQHQDITRFKPGRLLKRLLVMLLRSRQRHPHKNRVNDSSQKLPTKEEVVRNRALLTELLASLSQKLSPLGGKRQH